MKINEKGFALIKEFEGCEKVKDGLVYPYKDMVGVVTIGYGMTFYPGGKKVTLNDAPISLDLADYYFSRLLLKFETGVEALIKVRLNDNQFSALVSFAYNLGIGALAGSTLLKKVNNKASLAEIKTEFLKWVNAGKKKNVPGLIRRRTAEFELFKTI